MSGHVLESPFGNTSRRRTRLGSLAADHSDTSRPGDRRSRIQRWNDTVAGLAELQAEYCAWLMALPDNQQDSATAEALRTIVEFDLSELQAIEPPRGFGRDRTERSRLIVNLDTLTDLDLLRAMVATDAAPQFHWQQRLGAWADNLHERRKVVADHGPST